MRRTSIAAAKAHFSELVDEVEHHGSKIVILRHGKPAAALVPVHVVAPEQRRRKRWSAEQVRRSVAAFVEEFSAADPNSSAVDDLLAGRS